MKKKKRKKQKEALTRKEKAELLILAVTAISELIVALATLLKD